MSGYPTTLGGLQPAIPLDTSSNCRLPWGRSSRKFDFCRITQNITERLYWTVGTSVRAALSSQTTGAGLARRLPPGAAST